MTLLEHFLTTCNRLGDREAIVDDTGRVTFGELRNMAYAVGGLYRQVTDRPNVAVLLPSCKEFVASFFGACWAGKVVVPLNCLMHQEQLDFVVKDAGIDTIVTSRFFEKLAAGLAPKVVYLEDLASARSAPPQLPLPAADDQAAITILYTSGTTANPKGVVLTHRNLVSNVEAVVDAFELREADTLLGLLPLFHSFGLMTTLVVQAYTGARVAYLARFSAPRALDLIQQEGVAVVFAIASMYRVLVRSAKGDAGDTASLRLCIAGGEPLPSDVTSAVEEVFGVPLLEGYGLTETSPVVCVNEPTAHKTGTAGRAIKGVEIGIADEEGNVLPPNADGEIWVRGENIMRGYYNQPEETANVVTADGWFKTGDMGRLDEDGFLKITGRIKELIISSGENISPVEIEEVISRHPAVFEVGVVPMPDKSRGEVPKAFVALNEGAACAEQDLREFCCGKLPPYKIPRVFEFRDELPHGSTGKVLRRALRQ